MEKQKKTQLHLVFNFLRTKKSNPRYKNSTGPVRTCENQSLLVVLTLSSLCSQFILLVCHVTKIGKENPMHSLCAWLSLTASYPDIGKFWCLLVYPVPLGFNIKKTYPTPKKPTPNQKTLQQAKPTYLKSVYTQVLPEKSKSNLADTFYTFSLLLLSFCPSEYMFLVTNIEVTWHKGEKAFLFHNSQNQTKI